MPVNRPHFLGIGAQKAATTWLAHNLGQHPEIWMPPLKEIHYFDLVRGQVARHWAGEVGSDPRERLAISLFPRGTKASAFAWRVVRLGRRHPGWALRFLAGRKTDRWYESLFSSQGDKVTGEITPAYGCLDADGVAHVARCLPHARLVYILRDPVERAWSAARMQARRQHRLNLAEAPEADQLAYLHGFDSTRAFAHSDYPTHLARWETHYPPEQLHVAFFEDIAADSAGQLRSVYRFLGVSDNPALVPSDVARPVHRQASASTVPAAAGAWLTEHLLPVVEATHARFQNDHTANWLATSAQRLDA